MHAELEDARAAHELMVRGENAPKETALVAVQPQSENADLAPMLKAALDKLWQRPYDCRIFTLQLLQNLAQLDDHSLCSASSNYMHPHHVCTDKVCTLLARSDDFLLCPLLGEPLRACVST